MPTTGKRAFLTVAIVAGAALIAAGCGGDGGGGTGTAGTGSGTAGTTGSAGSAAGGTGGSNGTAGSSAAAGTSGGGAGTSGGGAGTSGGGAGTNGAAGTAAGGGGAGGSVAGAAGRGGTGGGAAGRGGTGGGAAGSGGTTGTAGRGGTVGTAGTGGGSAGRGGSGGAGTGGGAGGGAGTGGRITNPRIMPLGDSTTASVCYRALLWQMLTQSGRTQFNFVGTRNGDPGCGVSGYDRDNEGHGGYIVTDLLKAAGTGVRPGGADSSDPFVSDARDLATWFDGHPADIVLLHFATNDIWNNVPPATILQAYTTILGRLRVANPNVRVLVAQIIPLAPSGCNDCPTRVQNLNAMIPGWASQNSTAASPITVVDQNTGFSTATDTGDGVHPNATGSGKIAGKWFSALTPLF